MAKSLLKGKKPAPKKRGKRKAGSSIKTANTPRTKWGEVSVDGEVKCWKCGEVLQGNNSTELDYGMIGDKFWFSRRCKCGSGVKYRTTTGFEKIPTEKDVVIEDTVEVAPVEVEEVAEVVKPKIKKKAVNK